ncbi:MAG: haloacid dehalogenase [Rhodocyclaceae bacterium]|nr:MAG: haloacid dehalogenase [Rhodocyclaceae bacterium]
MTQDSQRNPYRTTPADATYPHGARTGIDGFVFDLDGTVALHDVDSKQYRLLPGAIECFEYLADCRIPHIIFTNGTARPPEKQIMALRSQGLRLNDDQLITPASVAAEYFLQRGLKRILVLGAEGAAKPLADLGLEVVSSNETPRKVDAVFVGWAPSFSNQDLDFACNQIWDGAEFFVSTDARFFANHSGKALSIAGAMAAGIHHVTQHRAEVLGKPSPYAMEYVARRLDCSVDRVAVVGDDPTLEIGMARENGAFAIGVTTGVAKEETFLAVPDGRKPNLVISDLREIILLMGAGK